jgi:hypothetical protein
VAIAAAASILALVLPWKVPAEAASDASRTP